MKNLGYSQNFLVNKKLVERLISKSNIDVTDYVIEIGPGKGIITDVLSQHAGEVVAVELLMLSLAVMISICHAVMRLPGYLSWNVPFDGAAVRPITEGISSYIHALPAL